MAEPPLGQHWPLNNVGKNRACSVSWTCSPGLCWTLLPACSWGHSPPQLAGAPFLFLPEAPFLLEAPALLQGGIGLSRPTSRFHSLKKLGTLGRLGGAVG